MKQHLAEKAATVEPGRARRGTGPALTKTQAGATRHPIFQLQGTIGNQAVNRLLQSGTLQTKLTVSRPGNTAVQRQESDEEELLQSSDNALQKRPEAPAAPPAQHPNRTGLPDHLKSGIEFLSGFSMDNVRVHYNSPQPAQLNALAYTQGTDIHVGPGQEQHLPHEAWHVVQQAQGRVQPTMQMTGGAPVNDDQGLEQEAEVMGARAEQMRQHEDTTQGVGDEMGRVVQSSGETEESSQSQEETIETTGAKGRLNFLSMQTQFRGLDGTNSWRADIGRGPMPLSVVQRRMGIEAEMSVPAPQNGPQATADQRIASFLSGSDNPGQQVQAPNNGFEIETDHDQLGTEIEGVRTALNSLLPGPNQIPLTVVGQKVPNLEYKTDPFDEETLPGRTAFLHTVGLIANDMTVKYINAHAGQVQVGGYRIGVPPVGDWVTYATNCRALGGAAMGITDAMVRAMRAAIMRRVQPNLYLQVTAGILPNKIAKHMKRAAQNRDVASLRNTIAHGADEMEKLLTAGAASTAKSAMNATAGLTKAQKNSSSLHGFLSLVVSYLYGNYVYYNGNTVGKNLVPFLSKTPLNEAQRELDVANRPDQLTALTRNALAANIQNRVVARVVLPDVAAFWPAAGGNHNGGPLGNWQGTWLPGVLDGTADAFSVNQLAGRTINPEDHARSKDITIGPSRMVRNPGGQERMGVIPLEFRHIEGSPDPTGLVAFVQQMIAYVRSING